MNLAGQTIRVMWAVTDPRLARASQELKVTDQEGRWVRYLPTEPYDHEELPYQQWLNLDHVMRLDVI